MYLNRGSAPANLRRSSIHSFVKRFSSTCAENNFGQDLTTSDSTWGSQAGFGNLSSGVPTFDVPQDADPTGFLALHTNDPADPNCRIKINHGTTTLAFTFQGGVIVAVDSGAAAGSFIVCRCGEQVTEQSGVQLSGHGARYGYDDLRLG
ncbi:hypothetical protein C8R47DRAFT_359031 [Mycena vitilis]|nr:hypothetical protein C8R47DRAFT_359031 [Mycena vitilis]